MRRILLVEDDPHLQRGMRDNLEFEGYEVVCAGTCAEARRMLRVAPPDVVIMDRMLPDGDGVDLCREARRNGFLSPIMLLTAKGEELDRVLGLESGADDYVVKPFSLRELLARVRALLRRSESQAPPPGPVRLGMAEVDFARHEIRRDGEVLEASALEFELLKYLHARRGQVVTREALLENVWGRKQSVETRTIDNFVVRVRKKIEVDPSKPRFLLTVHGSGYKLLAD